MGYKGRDIEAVLLEGDQWLITACDSCGGIGSKTEDQIKVPPQLVGSLTTRVVLLETLSVGAAVRMFSVAISSEPSPTGEGILEGVRDELDRWNLGGIPICISTEKNIPTCQTGLGITAIATCPRDALRVGITAPGDALYCLGLPRVGNEVKDKEDSEMVQGTHIMELLQAEGVHDIVPVGSKGILKEAEMLVAHLGFKVNIAPECDVDMHKSAGPSTCILFTCSPTARLPVFHRIPLNRVGSIVHLP